MHVYFSPERGDTKLQHLCPKCGRGFLYSPEKTTVHQDGADWVHDDCEKAKEILDRYKQ